ALWTPKGAVSGKGDGGERGGRCTRRAADSGKPAAGGDRRDAQSAAQMADKGIGRAKKFTAHARVGDEGAHEQKHRDDPESVVGDRPHRRLPDQLERWRAAVEISKARYADETH